MTDEAKARYEEDKVHYDLITGNWFYQNGGTIFKSPKATGIIDENNLYN